MLTQGKPNSEVHGPSSPACSIGLGALFKTEVELVALTQCRECSGSVSGEAAACPHCGAAAPARQKSGDWVPCKNCGSAKTQKFGPGKAGLVSLLTGSCLLWVPVLGWVLAPIFFLIAVILWLGALIPSGRVVFQCGECKKIFTVQKRELVTGEAKP